MINQTYKLTLLLRNYKRKRKAKKYEKAQKLVDLFTTRRYCQNMYDYTEYEERVNFGK